MGFSPPCESTSEVRSLYSHSQAVLEALYSNSHPMEGSELKMTDHKDGWMNERAPQHEAVPHRAELLTYLLCLTRNDRFRRWRGEDRCHSVF